MLAPETVALLGELDEPAIATPAAVRGGVLTFMTTAGRVAEQAARWQQLLRVADITETDADVRATFAELDQTLGAIRRTSAEAERHLRDLVAALRQLEAATQRIHERANGAPVGP